MPGGVPEPLGRRAQRRRQGFGDATRLRFARRLRVPAGSVRHEDAHAVVQTRIVQRSGQTHERDAAAGGAKGVCLGDNPPVKVPLVNGEHQDGAWRHVPPLAPDSARAGTRLPRESVGREAWGVETGSNEPIISEHSIVDCRSSDSQVWVGTSTICTANRNLLRTPQRLSARIAQCFARLLATTLCWAPGVVGLRCGGPVRLGQWRERMIFWPAFRGLARRLAAPPATFFCPVGACSAAMIT